MEQNQGNSFFGYSVSGAGDVNNDGFDDVIVGSYRYDNGESDEGVAFIFHGSKLGISATADTLMEPNKRTSFFGCSVSEAGDYAVWVTANNGCTDTSACYTFSTV